MKKWLFNPFVFIAGWQALGLGLLLMLITLIIASFSHTDFNGAIDIHFDPHFPVWFYIFEQLNAWLSTAIVFFIVGIILSKSNIRLIDVAGTLALARVPMLFAASIGFVPILHQLPTDKSIIEILIIALPLLLFSIWIIVLMYNAFTVSCNLKDSKAIVGFVVAIIISEILSKIIIYQVYHHFISSN